MCASVESSKKILVINKAYLKKALQQCAGLYNRHCCMAENMSCWHWRGGGVCCRLKVESAPLERATAASMSREVSSLASVSSVFSSCLSQCPVHPPQSDGEGSLNSNNPAQRQSIFYFIKGAAALLLGCNDPTDLPPIG